MDNTTVCFIIAGLLWAVALYCLRFVKHKGLQENLEAFLYLAPAGSVLTVFWFFPVLFSVAISFSDWIGASRLDRVEWIGVGNYSRAFQDPQFMQVLYNTVNYVIYSVPLTMAGALGVAVLLNGNLRGRNFFRTLYFLPYVTTWVAISIVFKYIFNEQFGLLNYLMNLMGLSSLAWLNEPRGIVEIVLTAATGTSVASSLHPLVAGPSLAMTAVILTSVWRDIGYFMVIFLAGLQNIDRSYYEAAEIDGAGNWAKFRTITWPLLSPTTFFILVVSLIAAFKVFVPMFIMTPNGTPGGTTETLVSYLYKIGFTGSRELGYASAIAYILFVIILLLTIFQNRIFGKSIHYS